MTTHYMLDIETMGKTPGCLILSAALARFDPLDSAHDPDQHPAKQWILDPTRQLLDGMTVDQSTQNWWGKQNATARNLLLEEDIRWDIAHALRDMVEFVRANSPVNGSGKVDVRVWAKSPDFDCSIIEVPASLYNIKLPWTYNQKRDVRTIVELPKILGGAAVPWTDPLHGALSDCYQQIGEIQQAIANLREYFVEQYKQDLKAAGLSVAPAVYYPRDAIDAG